LVDQESHDGRHLGIRLGLLEETPAMASTLASRDRVPVAFTALENSPAGRDHEPGQLACGNPAARWETDGLSWGHRAVRSLVLVRLGGQAR
jgi:hypothetical protein